jgi:hypothetical protein
MKEDPPADKVPPHEGAGQPALPGAAEAPSDPEGPGAKPLTPEEQMALFEKELKEKDWGHQPC